MENFDGSYFASPAENGERFASLIEKNETLLMTELKSHIGDRMRARRLIQKQTEIQDVPIHIDHTLIFQIGGNMGVERYYERRLDRTIQGLRTTTVAPAFLPSGWRIPKEVDVLHFHIDDVALKRFAEEDLNVNPAHIEILDTMGAEDGFTRAMAPVILEEMNSPYPSSKLMLDSFDLIIAGHLLRAYSNQSDKAKAGLRKAETYSREHDRMQRAKRFIDEQLEEGISMSDVASHVGMSQFHFTRSFKATLGESPNQYMLDQRIALARNMLTKTNDPIAEIAYACGFSSQAHLTTTLKNRLGTTPGKYRKITQQ